MLRLVESQLNDADAPRSQTSLAHSRIKGDLLAGRLPPGDKLRINDLAQQLEVSPGAIREALSRLVPEGLVVFRDQKGFVVAPLSLEDLQDLTQLRCDIEEIALRRSIANGDADWEANVLATAHRLRRTPRRMDDALPNSDWLAQHEKFHNALVSACGSPRLLHLRGQLHQQSERYRLLSVLVEGDRDVEAEHQRLVDAALDRNADELVAQARKHFQQTSSMIMASFAQPGVPPVDVDPAPENPL